MRVYTKQKEIVHKGISFNVYDEAGMYEWAEEREGNWGLVAVEQFEVKLPFDSPDKVKKIIDNGHVDDWEYKMQHGWIVTTLDGEVNSINCLYNDIGWLDTLDMSEIEQEEITFVKELINEHIEQSEKWE